MRDFLQEQKDNWRFIEAKDNHLISVHCLDVAQTITTFFKNMESNDKKAAKKRESFSIGSESDDSMENLAQRPVNMAAAKASRSQKWPCTFCDPAKFVAKHSRHLIARHYNEPEVSRIVANDNSELKVRLFAKLRLAMSFSYLQVNNLDPAHSTEVVQIYTRKDGSTCKMQRTVCPNCLRSVTKKGLASHMQHRCNETKIRQIQEILSTISQPAQQASGKFTLLKQSLLPR